jgi:hypothetical protein
MIFTKSELLASLQKEVRILLHLASKIDRSQLDYRPTPKQRSTIELLQYLSYMGPAMLRYAKLEPFDQDAWARIVKVAASRGFDETLAEIESHSEQYAALLADMDDAAFRAEMTGFDGSKTSSGSFIVNHVIAQCAAYRTQLFMYLKACGREELNTTNLWVGVDPPVAAV